MTTDLDELVQTLLMEGYALYPYTPGATKNATPTPFGIVYPPVYAAGGPTTFDRILMQGVVESGTEATLAVTVRFLEASGERHEAAERRVELPATPLAELCAGDGVTTEFAFERVAGRLRMYAQAFLDGITRVSMALDNVTEVPEGLDRGEALRFSFLSTHVIATVAGGRFHSPIDPPEHAATAVLTSACVNTYPVLATPEDDVLLGAAIILPDHPQIAPESRGDLFDGTEIEEALLLHLLALSDGEREEIAHQDPAITEMLRRAIETTPEEFEKLRGRITISDPAYPAPPAGGAALEDDQEVRGEESLVVDGITYRRGDHVVLRPEEGRNAHDHLLAGRMATIERVYVDYEDKVHLCVTVDDDPGQDIMRDIGRYLYFKPDEVEVMAGDRS
jgi:hypothetical protein